MKDFWNKETEKRFFKQALKNFATVEKLFYKTNKGEYFAYWKKKYEGERYTLQSRNSLIGNFTEKYSKDLLQETVQERNLYAVNNVVCKEIGLTRRSPADVVISKRNQINLRPEDIVLIVEVKMSLVWNWRYEIKGSENIFKCVGDYLSHAGTPGLLRSDSMLKAIGKSINIRVSDFQSSKIPIIILGNTPITNNYYDKVDHLKIAGIIQGFCSINPSPINDTTRNIKSTPKHGFIRFDRFDEFKKYINKIISSDYNFFSSMKNRKDLGIIIEKANKKQTYEEKAEEFLRLIRN